MSDDLGSLGAIFDAALQSAAALLTERDERILALTAELEATQGYVTLANEEHTRLTQEVTRLRATNTRLNRRCTDADGALAEKIAAYPHQSLGRALANAGYQMERAKVERLEAALTALRPHFQFRGLCKQISLGDGCACPLCVIDRALDAPILRANGDDEPTG